jgi:hypothetical protein
MEKLIMRQAIIFLCAVLIMTGCRSNSCRGKAALNSIPGVKAIYTAEPLKLDGELSDPAWKRSKWVTLDRSRPERPQTGEQWEQIYSIAGARKHVVDQFAQKVKAAVVWSEKGLYFGLMIDDIDIQGKMTHDNDWIWLEDVVEVFLAGGPKANVCEIQVNPSNTIFFNNSKPDTALNNYRPKTAVYVNGSINDSKNIDKYWSVEIFLPWSFLEKTGLAIKPGKREVPMHCSYVRFAAWDLSIYSQLRVNRFTSPGKANPHHPECYRPLICLSPSG